MDPQTSAENRSVLACFSLKPRESSDMHSKEDAKMDRLIAIFTRAKIYRKQQSKGQTMTEYTLILAAIAILVFAAYTTTGNDIQQLVAWGSIHQDLTAS
jgi:Flp pilus assembly pilin Flp